MVVNRNQTRFPKVAVTDKRFTIERQGPQALANYGILWLDRRGSQANIAWTSSFSAQRHFFRSDREMDLDRVDRKLLNAVQRDNRLTTGELGELAGLSATACQRRLKRLRDAGVIEADVSVVSPQAVGRPLLMLASVTLERDRADIIDRFKQAVRRTPEIMSGYYVTGEADFILTISVRDMVQYEEFTRNFFAEYSDIKGFKTMVVMDRVKASLALPIDE